MMKAKSPQDVYGYQSQCPNFQQCPLCFGCRNYDISVVKCVENCGTDKKKNVCNTEKHKAELVAKFITKEAIKI